MNGDALIIPLDGRECDISVVGGKAINLNKMTQAGFSVPRAVSVACYVYEDFLRDTGLYEIISRKLEEIDYTNADSIVEKSAEIRQLIMDAEFPENVMEATKNIFSSHFSKYFAVRSSAVAEDLEDASFAGQQDTYLNVVADDVPYRVKCCWASYWTDRAVKYRHDAGINHLEQGIAVVIQKMVESEISGVMFTADPLTGKDDIIIEASWGLGESIASGIVTPDHYTYSRDGKIECQVMDKHQGYFLRDGKNTLVDIEPDKVSVRCASDEIIKAVAEQGLILEKHFNMPQDIEWAYENGKVYILQSRAVTTLGDFSEKDGKLWSRAYGDEYWADATTPLFYTTMGKMLVEIVNHEGARKMGYKDLYDAPLIKLHKTRVYFYAYTLECVFAHYPKFIRSKEILNYFPVKDHERILAMPNDYFHAALSQIKIALGDRDGMINRTDKAYKKWAAEFMEFCRENIDSKDLTAMSDEEIDKLYWDLETASMKHYRLIRYGMVSHSILFNLLAKNWLKKWLNDDGSIYATLMAGLPGNKTVATNIAFTKLAKVIKDNPDISEKIESMGFTDFLAWMDSNENVLTPAMDEFLAEFGHRSNTREIMVPRWREDREYVLNIALQISKNYTDVAALEKQRASEREAKLEEVKGQLGFFKRKILGFVLRIAQTYLTFRENQRFYLDHILYRQRVIFLEIGRRFVEKGLLGEVNDIFFLEESEIFAMLKGEAGPDAAVFKKRKDDFEKYAPHLPPKFLMDGIDFDDPDDITGAQDSIGGAASSPGTYTGTIRVITDIRNLAEVQEGEILVTSNTDPGWTAVFSRLGGLITETGGILCHGAVISREYHIPAVTAVKDATKKLHTGQKVTLDGSNGIIHILEE